MRKTLLCAVLAALGLAAPLRAADTLNVAISQRGFWNSMFIPFGVDRGFFAQEGLDLSIVYTEGGATTLNAIISGSVDIAMSNGLLGTIAAYVKGAPIRVITAETDGAPDSFWWAKASSGIRSLKDTTGRSIGFSSPGSSSNITILDLVRQAGVQPKLVPTGGLPATTTQVMSGQIDVGWAVPPAHLKEVEEGSLVIVARGRDAEALARQTVRVNLANATALTSKRDAIQRFVRALARSIDWAYTTDQALADFAKENAISIDIARRTRDDFFPRAAMDLPAIIGVDLVLQDAASFKYIPRPMAPQDIAGLFDIIQPAKGLAAP